MDRLYDNVYTVIGEAKRKMPWHSSLFFNSLAQPVEVEKFGQKFPGARTDQH